MMLGTQRRGHLPLERALVELGVIERDREGVEREMLLWELGTGPR